MERIRCGMVGGEMAGVYIWDVRYPIDQVIGSEFSSFLPFLLYGTVDFFHFFYVAQVNFMGPRSVLDFDINAPTRIRW